ncbi:MAG: hypothetical protein Q9163_004530 [Psora crenata]
MPQTAFLDLPTLARGYSGTYVFSFLYCTKTILSGTSQQSQSFRAYPRPRLDCRQFGHKPLHLLYRADHQSQGDIPFESEPILEIGTGSVRSSKKDPQQRSTPSSTLTASEIAIFDRIFKDEEEAKARKEEETQKESLDGGSGSVDDPYEDLNKIFDAAIREFRKQEDKQTKSMEKNRLLYEKTAFQRALDSPSTKERAGRIYRGPIHLQKGFARPLQFTEGNLVQPSIGDVEESDERLRIACEEHRVLVDEMLEETTTDAGIWEILETEVFSMVKQLKLEMELEEKLIQATRKAKVKASRESSRLKPPTEASEQAFASLLSSESKALTTNTLLAILQTNYAHYNLYALRLWRRRHPSTNYSLQLLPHIKSLGSISYVLGTSAALYNEVLFVKWDKYSDLHGIADLLQEMINQGVAANIVTLELLKYIDRTRIKDILGRRGKVLSQWWKLKGVREDWTRVRDIYTQLKQEHDIYSAGNVGMELQDMLYAEEEERGRQETGPRISRVKVR